MNKYAELDAAILKKIAAGKNTFVALCGGELERMADAIGGKDQWGQRRGWRIIDRRLQAMRKAGKIKFSRATAWSIV